MSAQVQTCRECATPFEGTRTEARRARWEPYSSATQHALDCGPLVCPECVAQLLDDLLDAMLTAARAGRH